MKNTTNNNTKTTPEWEIKIYFFYFHLPKSANHLYSPALSRNNAICCRGKKKKKKRGGGETIFKQNWMAVSVGKKRARSPPPSPTPKIRVLSTTISQSSKRNKGDSTVPGISSFLLSPSSGVSVLLGYLPLLRQLGVKLSGPKNRREVRTVTVRHLPAVCRSCRHCHVCCPSICHLHLSLNREGRWGTTDDFTSSVLHLFYTALRDLANSRPNFVFPSLPLSALSSSPLHCVLHDGFVRT